MDLTAGDWVELNDGGVARVIEIDAELGTVLAERLPGGSVVERPLSFAAIRWNPLSPEGLKVRRAVDPASLRELASKHPIDVVVAALVDGDGQTTSEQLRAQIVPDPVADDSWERWWRRLQPKLEDDPRIDASRSREKRYRLLRDGEKPIATYRPALQVEERLGRILADAPQLREARKAARENRPLSTDELALVQIETEIASNPRVDPTDRFMAAELAVWTDRMSADEAKALLGADVVAIDLLRVPQNELRDRAIEWACGYLGDLTDSRASNLVTLVSAVAAGPPWAGQALRFASGSHVASRRVAEGFLGWAVPGADETGPAKFPDDLETLERRIERAQGALQTLSPSEAAGFFLGALRALDVLPDANTHAKYRERLFADTARLAWQARKRTAPASPPRLDERGDLRPEAMRVLIETSARDDIAALEPAVRAAFRKRPNEYASVFELMARSNGQDPAVKAMEVIRDVASASGLRPLAAHAFAWGAANNSAALGEIASLAGTIAPDDQGVRLRLDQIAREHAEAALAGEVMGGAVWFSGQSWAKFGGSLLQRIDDALSRERLALGERERLTAEIASLESAASQLSDALKAAREGAGTAGRESAVRMASSVLKPVAMAVADSYEGQSLEALQDALLAVLARARMRPIGAVGAIQPYDPERHLWVGAGQPTTEVQLISPGFAGRGEEDRDITLVPARCIAPA